MKNSPFAIGQRWHVTSEKHGGWCPFDFVVVAKGSKPDRKVFRLEAKEEDEKAYGKFVGNGHEQEYTHKHVKKFALWRRTNMYMYWSLDFPADSKKGSTLSLDHIARRLVDYAGVTYENAFKAATQRMVPGKWFNYNTEKATKVLKGLTGVTPVKGWYWEIKLESGIGIKEEAIKRIRGHFNRLGVNDLTPVRDIIEWIRNGEIHAEVFDAAETFCSFINRTEYLQKLLEGVATVNPIGPEAVDLPPSFPKSYEVPVPSTLSGELKEVQKNIDLWMKEKDEPLREILACSAVKALEQGVPHETVLKVMLDSYEELSELGYNRVNFPANTD